MLLALGLVWLFGLSMIIVCREEGDLRWATVKRRLRLNAPRGPATGQPRARLWLWVVPFIVGRGDRTVLNTPIENAWVSVFPFLAEPTDSSPTPHLRLAGDPRAARGRLVVPGLVRGSGHIQHDHGGGVPLSWSVAAQDGKGCSDAGVGWPTAYFLDFITFIRPGGYQFGPYRALVHVPCLPFREYMVWLILHSAQSVYFAFLLLGDCVGVSLEGTNL